MTAMPNEMRERLIEILNVTIHPKEGVDPAEVVAAEVVADYLLDNGVIVPPCKVGDVVYVIEPCSCHCGHNTFEECHHRRTNATKWIKGVMIANKHHNRCLKLFERPYKAEYIFKIGKTVFLTREEAEQALKGGVQNEADTH